MSEAPTVIDKIGLELHEMAEVYAQKAEGLATDPYFRDAVVKVAVSNFVWALYHAFDERGQAVLFGELQEQTAAVGKSVNFSEGD